MGFASYPNPAFGYYRGVGAEGPFAGGQGSMMGQKSSGLGFLSQGQGMPAGAATGWDPTIVYLLILTVAEMVIFGVLARMLR